MSTAAAGSAARRRWPRRSVLVTLLVISAVLNLFFVAGAAWTRLYPPPARLGPVQWLEQMAGELNLDTQQRGAFDRYAAAMRTRSRQMHQEVEQLIEAARQEIAKPQPDMTEVMRLFDAVGEQRRKFLGEAASQTIEFLSVLSPEQRGRFVELERERHARRHHH